jgi:hypothetical protein
VQQLEQREVMAAPVAVADYYGVLHGETFSPSTWEYWQR